MPLPHETEQEDHTSASQRRVVHAGAVGQGSCRPTHALPHMAEATGVLSGDRMHEQLVVNRPVGPQLMFGQVVAEHLHAYVKQTGTEHALCCGKHLTLQPLGISVGAEATPSTTLIRRHVCVMVCTPVGSVLAA